MSRRGRLAGGSRQTHLDLPRSPVRTFLSSSMVVGIVIALLLAAAIALHPGAEPQN